MIQTISTRNEQQNEKISEKEKKRAFVQNLYLGIHKKNNIIQTNYHPRHSVTYLQPFLTLDIYIYI